MVKTELPTVVTTAAFPALRPLPVARPSSFRAGEDVAIDVLRAVVASLVGDASVAVGAVLSAVCV